MKIYKEILSDIKKHGNKVKIFWDVDGCLSEYTFNPTAVKNNEKGYFLDKRPMEITIKIMKELFEAGAETYILTLCNYKEQVEDKKLWFLKNISFVKNENIIIIPKKEPTIVAPFKSKYSLKARYIKERTDEKEDIIYYVDDEGKNLKECYEELKYIKPVHISCFIK